MVLAPRLSTRVLFLSLLLPRVAAGDECLPWALYFGPEATTQTLRVESADRFSVHMRNVAAALAFQFGVKATPSAPEIRYDFSGDLGADPPRRVEVLITDFHGNAQAPATPNAAIAFSAVRDLERGRAIAGFADRDYFVFDLAPAFGGPGFTVGYVSDLNPPQGGGNVIPETPDAAPCPLNEILVVRLEGGNRPPDCSAARASVSELWPPNHKFVRMDVLGVVDAEGEPVSITFDGISQDEPVTARGIGSGHTSPDGALVDENGDGAADAAYVRRERDGTGNGRVYTIAFTATDGKGMSCTGTVQVCVPHDQSRLACKDDGQAFDSLDGEAGAMDGKGPIALDPPPDAFPPVAQPLFVRGDVNWDDRIQVTDGIAVLRTLFQGEDEIDCDDAADANDDGKVGIDDAICIFSHLFMGGAMAPPIEDPGADPTPDDIGCERKL